MFIKDVMILIMNLFETINPIIQYIENCVTLRNLRVIQPCNIPITHLYKTPQNFKKLPTKINFQNRWAMLTNIELFTFYIFLLLMNLYLNTFIYVVFRN